MSLFRRMLEWYLGLPGAQAGQRTDWRFEFPAAGASWLSGATVVLGVAAAVYLIAIYWRDAASVSRRVRLLLARPRLSVVALALLCLLQMTVSVGRIGLPSIALLIDNSPSMGLDDRYPDDQTNELADQLVREAGVTAKTRLSLAQAILTRNDGQFLRQLLKNHTLRLYRFSDTAVRVAPRDFTSPDEIPELTRKIR